MSGVRLNTQRHILHPGHSKPIPKPIQTNSEYESWEESLLKKKKKRKFEREGGKMTSDVHGYVRRRFKPAMFIA